MTRNLRTRFIGRDANGQYFRRGLSMRKRYSNYQVLQRGAFASATLDAQPRGIRLGWVLSFSQAK